MSIEEMNNQKVIEIKKIFNDLFNELNHMGNEGNVEDALSEILGEQHRTLQQNYFRHVIIPSIKIFSEKHNKKFTDLRNEASCELAKQILPLIKNAPLPFI